MAGRSITVIGTVAVSVVESTFVPPPRAVTVTLAAPLATPVTRPLLLTVAMAVLLELKAKVGRTVALAESTRATNGSVVPRPTDAGLGDTRKLLMLGGRAITRTVTESVSVVGAKPAAVPVTDTTIVAVPGATADTSPSADGTVATVGAREMNAAVTVTEGSARSVVMVSAWVRPTLTSAVRGATVNPRSAGTLGRTVTVTTCDSVVARVPPPLPSTVTVTLVVPGVRPATRPVESTVATAGALD